MSVDIKGSNASPFRSHCSDEHLLQALQAIGDSDMVSSVLMRLL